MLCGRYDDRRWVCACFDLFWNFCNCNSTKISSVSTVCRPSTVSFLIFFLWFRLRKIHSLFSLLLIALLIEMYNFFDCCCLSLLENHRQNKTNEFVYRFKSPSKGYWYYQSWHFTVFHYRLCGGLPKFCRIQFKMITN